LNAWPPQAGSAGLQPRTRVAPSAETAFILHPPAALRIFPLRTGVARDGRYPEANCPRQRKSHGRKPSLLASDNKVIAPRQSAN